MVRKNIPFVCGVLLLSACLPVAAQTTGSARPFHGALFGSFRTQNTPQTLDVSGMLLEAYDDNLFATLGGNVDPRSRPSSGFYTMPLLGIDYRLTHRRYNVAVVGASALGYYPDVHEVRSISHNLGAGVSATVTQRTNILLNQTAAYSPSYFYGLFPTGSEVAPGDTQPNAPNYSVSESESYSYGTTATLSFGISRRTTALIGGNYRYTDFTNETLVQKDQTSEGLDGQFLYQHTRNFGLQFGYHHLTGNVAYGGAVHTNENRVEGGLTYSRQLSPSRRMTLSFNLGASAISSRGAPAELQVPDRLDRASVDASADYPFALYWTVRGAYRRGLEFVPGLAQPVYANGATVGLDGLLTRRFELGFAGAYSQGRSVLTAESSQYDTYTGSARLQYALTPSTAIHIEYFYYFYDFLGNVTVVSGAPQRMERNGVRVGLRLLVPAFRG